MKKNVLLWLEDKPEEIADLINEAKNKFDEVYIRRTPMGIKRKLEANQGTEEKDVHICGIVVDVMLSHITDLEDVGLKSIKTPGGFDAGFLFLKHIILKNPQWKKIPICIFTQIGDSIVADWLRENLKEGEMECGIVIEKFIGNWKEEFSAWIDNILKK